MNPKEYLKQLQRLDYMISNKTAERMRWKEIASGTTGQNFGERVQSSGNPRKMEHAIASYVDIDREIESDVVKMMQKKKEIIGTIEQLPPLEYDVLHLIYVQFRTLQDAADKHEKTYSWATSIHGRALKHVGDILAAREAEKNAEGSVHHD